MAYTYKRFDLLKDTRIKESQRVLTETTVATSPASALINSVADFGSTSASDAWTGGPTKGDLYNYIAAKFYNGSNILKADDSTSILIAGVSIIDSDSFLDKIAVTDNFVAQHTNINGGSISAADGTEDPNEALVLSATDNAILGKAFLNYGLFVFDLSTNNLGTSMTADMAEYTTSYIYFCRAHMDEFNYSLNNTFSTTADAHAGTYRIKDDLAGDPRTYITGVGLYNDSGDLLAVAKTNVPRLKNDENETLFRIKVSI
jgi:hypothetical protein